MTTVTSSEQQYQCSLSQQNEAECLTWEIFENKWLLMEREIDSIDGKKAEILKNFEVRS